MNSSPSLSVLMCIYKEVPHHLEQAVDSILNQTYGDFEFIIINDNPDDILLDEVIRRKKDKRILYYRNPENIGLTRSLNLGLKKARGKFIARMDADDISLPNRFTEQVTFLTKHENIDVVGSWAYIIDSNGKTIGKLKRALQPDILKSLLIFESPLFHPSVMMRNRMAGKHVAYDENYKYSQDYELWTRISDFCQFSNIPHCLICYRYSDIQISSHHLEVQQETAFSIQIRQLKKYNITLTADEKYLFRLLTRKQNKKKTVALQKLRKFLCRLISELCEQKDIDVNIVSKHIIHLYATYLTQRYYLWRAFYELFKFQWSAGKINLYAIGSLLKNNKLWHVCSNE